MEEENGEKPLVKETYETLYHLQYNIERLFNFIGFIAINSIDVFILNRLFLKEDNTRNR